MHDVMTIGLPLLAILAGILLNRSDFKDLRTEISSLRGEMHSEISSLRGEMHSEIFSLRGEMRSENLSLRSEMNRRFDAVDAELRYFHGTVGKLDGRIEALEKR